jgi:hypothetical protein
VAAVVSTLVTACSDSNDMTGPGAVGAASDLSGTWSGQYESNLPALCSGAGDATATLTQSGNEVRGTFKAAGCGIGGAFRGELSGNTLTGAVAMAGCTGGAVTGRFEAGALTLSVGDFRKDLVAGDAEVLPGGRAQLQR